MVAPILEPGEFGGQMADRPCQAATYRPRDLFIFFEEYRWYAVGPDDPRTVETILVAAGDCAPPRSPWRGAHCYRTGRGRGKSTADLPRAVSRAARRCCSAG